MRCVAMLLGVLAACGSVRAEAVISSEVYNAGGVSVWTNASSLPVSNSDLINGLLPISTNYVGTLEAQGGTTAPFTDGRTSTDGSPSQMSNNQNCLFDLGQDWYVTYQLPARAGGWDLGSIVTTSGHQDSRVNQFYDVLVSSDGTTFASLSGGAGFAYSPSVIGTTFYGPGGATQTTITDTTGVLASGVNFIRWQTMDSGNGVYRELDVFPVPEPISIAVVPIAALLVRRRATSKSASWAVTSFGC